MKRKTMPEEAIIARDNTVPLHGEPKPTVPTTVPSTATNQRRATATNLSTLSPTKMLTSESPKTKLKVNLKILKEKAKETKDKQQKNAETVRSKGKSVIAVNPAIAELKQLEDPPRTQREMQLCAARLQYMFYDVPCERLAENLLGKVLVRQLENGTLLKGRIVETEGYLGVIDKASHTYQNRITPRNIPMYMPPGTIYVYMTYGMYHCFNISSRGDGCAVLVRAVDPIEGMSCMANNRNHQVPGERVTAKRTLKDFKRHELCNGPSKLCIAYQLDRNHSRYSMCTWKGLWLENDLSADTAITIVRSTRIGIDKCGSEWAKKLLRYYVYGNKCVSKRDREAESLLNVP